MKASEWYPEAFLRLKGAAADAGISFTAEGEGGGGIVPTFDFICETCGRPGRAWRQDQPPRFCSRECMREGLAGMVLKPLKYTITPEVHEMIRRVYERDTGNGQVRALCKRLGLPRWKITRHAQKQGWVAKQRAREPDWSEREIGVLERNAQHGPVYIQKRLRASGFKRSMTGIQIKRKRLKLVANLDGYSAHQAALGLGVDEHFITKAIAGGRLTASRRKQERTPQQGGNSYYIRPRNLRAYILDYVNEIDLRKVDKFWFVDVVAGRGM